MARVDLFESIPLQTPLSLLLETTNICNFKCSFCPESLHNYKELAGGHHMLSEDDFELILKQVSEFEGRVKNILFYVLGEPFANKKITSYIAKTKAKNVSESLSLTSNGSLVRESKYEEICQSGLDNVRFSIYGSNNTMHQEVTGSKVDLSLIKDNISGLKAFRDAHGFETPRIAVKMIRNPNEQINEEFLTSFDGMADDVYLENVMNWNGEGETDFSALGTSDSVGRTIKRVCPSPFYSLVIHSDLNVSVCCVDWNKKTVVGNLRQNTLSEIWQGERLRHFQRMHVEGRRFELEGCKNCDYVNSMTDDLDGLTVDEFDKRCGCPA